ncbi:MAG: response regulator [Candidatus Sericytochromatia bacterium]|nr:response regulator [Candidatus Tanganyikabacteria bacterium]
MPKVLVLEDDPTNATLMEVILSHEGFAVEVCRRAEDAFDLARVTRFDLVVVDLDLPGSRYDGMELIRRLKAAPETAALPIIACTAALLRFEASEAKQAGAAAFLAKPYTVDNVRKLVHGLINGS